MTNPPVSRYQQVADHLRTAITSGEYAPGAILPSESALADQFDLNRTTINKAIRQLVSEGLVTIERGRGTRVRERRELVRWGANRYLRDATEAPHRREAVAGGWTDEFSAELTQTTATPEVAQRLSIEPGDPVSQAVYLRTVDSEPVQISTQWEPLAITRGTTAEDPSDGSLGSPDVITRFERIGVTVSHVAEAIRSRMPIPSEIAALGLAEGTPVITVERTHWADEVPVETADIVLRSDRTVISNRQTVHSAPSEQ